MSQEEKTFLEILNSKLQSNERILKVHKAELNDHRFTVTLLVNAYQYDQMLTPDFKERIYQFAVEILPKDLPLLDIKYKKTFTSEDVILRAVLKYIYDEFAVLSPKICKDLIAVAINKNTIKISIRMPRYIYSYCESNQFAEKATAYLEREFMENVVCETKIDDTLVSEASEPLQGEAVKNMLGLIEISIKESIMQGVIAKAPIYIKHAKDKPATNVVICGKVKSITQKEAKATGQPFFTFILDDATSAINVTAFPKKENEIEALKKLIENQTIVCSGNIKYSIYDHANSMIANKISYCTIDFDAIKQAMNYKGAPSTYSLIHPQPYIEQGQDQLFQANFVDQTAGVPDSKEYVVFDFETTGLNIKDGAQPIELGAVKIKNGEIVEQFSSFIRIDKPLTKEIINLTGITDNDLIDAPLIEDIIADFYKFTKGTTLVGHNIPFDMAFLDKYSRPMGYAFDNDCIDTVNLAKLKIKAKDYKLSTLIDEFGIKNHIAHRALYDAIATAKLFLQLNKMVNL